MYSILMEISYDGSLEGLFRILDAVSRGAPLPDRVRRLPCPGFRSAPAAKQGPSEPCSMKPGSTEHGSIEPGEPVLYGGISPAAPVQRELFEEPPGTIPGPGLTRFAALAPTDSRVSPADDGPSHPLARELFEASADAYGAFLHGWMSEYPIEGDIIRFGWRVLSAAREAGAVFGIASPEARAAAERVSTDRGDRGTETVLKAAYRVSREIHRLMGFLRFTRDARGRYLARCAPDHFILPCLAAHLSRRFGAETWAVIDEKRGLTLLGLPGEGPRLVPEETRRAGNPPASPVPRTAGFPRPDPGNPPAEPREPPPDDPWEELWRNYHRSINNGDRKNPGLQLRFMPLRYWKYLPEMNFQSPGDAARRD